MSAKPIREFVFTFHARQAIARRRLPAAWVVRVLERPDDRWPVRQGRDVLQARIDAGGTGRRYLVRMFVDVERAVPEIVTAYLTRRFEKYERPQP